jgi:hypothetical protein
LCLSLIIITRAAGGYKPSSPVLSAEDRPAPSRVLSEKISSSESPAPVNNLKHLIHTDFLKKFAEPRTVPHHLQRTGEAEEGLSSERFFTIFSPKKYGLENHWAGAIFFVKKPRKPYGARAPMSGKNIG